LKRLTINLRLIEYDDTTASVASSTHQILNILGSTLPPLSRLEICVDNTFRAFLIHIQIDAAAIDAVLAQYPPSAISAIAIRFGVKLSRGVEAALAQETFRQDGLRVLREAFPRLNAGARRRVYDSVASKTWQDRERADMLEYWGMFSVEYTYPQSNMTEGDMRTGDRDSCR
jgi:hypothetical protein